MRSTTLSIEPEKYRAAVSAMKQHLFHEEEEIATTLKNHVLCSLDVSIWYNGQIRFFLHTKNSKKKGWQSEKIDVRLIVKDNIIQQNSYFFARNGATDIGQKYLPQVYRALGPLLKKAPGKFKMACKQIRGLDIP